MRAVVYVTAHDADVKIINRFLLHIRDWEYGEDPLWDTTSIVRRGLPGKHDTEDPPADVPPLQSTPDNEWSGTAFEDLERALFTTLKSADGTDNGTGALFLVLDDQGVRDQTVIIAERGVNSDPDDGPLYANHINKVRVPWDEAYMMWCNLDIANMGFEDYCDQEQGPDWGYWWTYSSIGSSEETVEEIKQKRDAAIKELEKLDLA